MLISSSEFNTFKSGRKTRDNNRGHGRNNVNKIDFLVTNFLHSPYKISNDSEIASFANKVERDTFNGPP